MQYSFTFVLLFIIELLYFFVAKKFNIIDKPNERSSHSKTTLRGGGVIFYFAIMIFFILNHFEYPYFFIGLSIISLVSFFDDISFVPKRIRLSVHFISILLIFYQVGLFNMSWWMIPLLLFFAIGIINAYNFMDGINGITVFYSLSVLLLFAIANYFNPFIDSDFIYYSLLSCLVFGFFNFRNTAKCFAGDVGSVAMAFIILFLLIKLVIHTNNYIFVLFLLVYGVDTAWTIVRRLLRKENILLAHRTHLYQFFANENNSNRLLISTVYGMIQFLIGLLIIYISSQDFYVQWATALGLIVLCSVVYLWLKSYLIKKHNIQ